MSSLMTLKRYPSASGMTFGKMGARRMMWSINNLLPKGARWVEYLESTGTQWIDTGVNVGYSQNSIGGLEAKFSLQSNQSVSVADTSPWIVGCWENSQANAFLYKPCSRPNLENLAALIFRNTRTSASPLSLQSWHTVSIRNGMLKQDNANVGTYPTSPTGASTLPIALFALRQASMMYAKVKFAYCRMYGLDDTTIIRDFRPIAIGASGYMLDLISGEYLQYGNAGTGDFVIGPDAPAPTI